VAGEHTLTETELAVAQKLDGLVLDFEAMAIASNLFRAANAVRNHMERSVLAPHDLTWTAFVVLWVTWIWEPVETRTIAAEGGFSKATLSGVLTTLEARGLVSRTKSKTDGRLVMVELTPAGRRLMKKLFPKFNSEEQFVVANIKQSERREAADMLRAICLAVKTT
jgi:DNA-binding MarR family transcriptional regulator